VDYLFDVWQDVEEKIKEAGHIFLFLDYDGTLTPLVESPDLAAMPDKAGDALRRISKTPGYRLCIVSGRSLADVKKKQALKESAMLETTA